MANKIPLVVPPEEDEYIHSYLCRLAKINGFSNVVEFIYYYASDDIYKDYNDYKVVSHIARRLCRNISYPVFAASLDFTENVIDLFLSLSLYPCISPLMLPSEQVVYLNNVFRSKRDFDEFIPFLRGSNNDLLFCEQCLQEQLNTKGYYWYVRSHQLPGVQVCHRHNCSLSKYVGSVFDCVKNDSIYGDVVNDIFTSHDYSYASFVNAFNQKSYQISRNDLKRICCYKFLNVSESEIRMMNTKLSDLSFEDKDKNRVYQSIKAKRMLTTVHVNILMLLYVMFNDISEFDSYYQMTETGNYIPNEYNAVGKYRNNIAMFRHSCGCKFVGTSYGIDIGWGCPDCTSKYTDKEFASYLFKKAYPEHYSMTKDYVTGDKYISIKHDLCGRVQKIPFNKMYSKTSCECMIRGNAHLLKEIDIDFPNKTRKADTVKAEKNVILAKENSEYYIDEYIDSKSPVKIKHSVCGHTFGLSRMPSSFDDIMCPYCFDVQKRSHGRQILADIHGSMEDQDSFLQSMKDLTGDEYSLVGNYSKSYKKISLRHNVCGEIIEMVPTKFCHGQRCPCKTIQLTFDQVNDIVQKHTEYRYHIEHGDSCFMHILVDNINGDKYQLTTAELLQELNRPTPSKIIDNRYRHPVEIVSKGTIKPKYIQIYDVILQNIGKEQSFKIKDLKEFSGFNWAQLRNGTKILLEHDLLRKVSDGVYCIT